jgi:hypothetical protein
MLKRVCLPSHRLYQKPKRNQADVMSTGKKGELKMLASAEADSTLLIRSCKEGKEEYSSA